MNSLIKAMALSLLLALSPAGCVGTVSGGENVVSAPYNGNAMQNFYLGRTYMAQGRYELAREHLLAGLASAEDEEMRQRLAMELEAIDKIIASRR